MNKQVLLVDVDSKIPNLALMKISSYYKSKGYNVELQKLGFDYYPKKRDKIIINAEDFDEVFVSIIFSLNKNVVEIINNKEVKFGGTGYDLSIKLSKEVEKEVCDYSIYPENKISYGFLSRGCPNKCYFCQVPKKEGNIHKADDIDSIVKHNKVKFLDNNILSYPGHKEILKEIIDKKIKCQFNQGLDIRLINEENAELLSKINYIGEYIFAFDQIENENLINKKLEIVKKYIKKDWRLKFFIYCHPNMDLQKDVLYRIKWCMKNKVLPYLMRDISCWDSKYNHFYIDLTAWCNQPAFFKKTSFQIFMQKRTNNKERRKRSIELFGDWENKERGK